MLSAVTLPTRDISQPNSAQNACDNTRPATNDQSVSASLARLQDDWHSAARYMVTLSKDGDWNDKSIVATWLTYAEANRIRERLDAELLAKQGGSRRWAEAAYGITMHTPELIKTSMAEVGDLVFHEYVEPHSEFSLSDTYILRQFLLAAKVTAIDASGQIVAFRDRHGEHLQRPRKPHVASASVIDVDRTIAYIAVKESERGHWAGEFLNAKEIEALLVRFQRIQNRSLCSSIDLSLEP